MRINKHVHRIGPPPEPREETVTPIPEPILPLKRGRPRVHADDNARKLASKQKKKEPDRQRMIRGILNKVRQLLSKPDFTSTRFWEMVNADREYMNRLRTNLGQLPYADVLKYYERLISKQRGIFDASGRLPGERSGEASRVNGMSELESILAAVQENLPAKPVSPDGAAPDGGGNSVYTRGDGGFEKLLERAAVAVAERDWGGPRVYEHEMCLTRGELENYILKRYRKGEKDIQFYALVSSIQRGEGAPRIGVEVNHYHGEVYFMMSELEKADKKRGTKARKLTRLAREQRTDRLFSSPPSNPT
jgi:hypothetical protein